MCDDLPAFRCGQPRWVWGITMAAWSRSRDLIKYVTGLWHRRSLRRAFLEAKYALGERMYSAGIDDGWLAAQIAVLDYKIRQAKAAGVLSKAFVADRKRLILHWLLPPWKMKPLSLVPIPSIRKRERPRKHSKHTLNRTRVRRLDLFLLLCDQRIVRLLIAGEHLNQVGSARLSYA